MESIKCLFHLLDKYVSHFPDKGMLYAKINGVWTSLTAREVENNVTKLSSSLIKLGMNGNDFTPEKQDKIAIIANNRPEWVITDFATQLTGAVLVPLYPSVTELEWQYILNESAASILFISDKNIYKKLKNVLQDIPSLKHIYSFDEIEGVAHWSTLLEPPDEDSLKKILSNRNEIKPEYLATIIYTSGTTGNPKGVMLSHHNIISNVDGSMDAFDFCNSDENVLSFLPLNHIFERTVMYLYINKGVSVYFAEGMETIGENLREVKPVVFTTVPRLLEKVYEKIDAKGRTLTGIKRKLFDWAVSLALKFNIGSSKSFFYILQLKIADILIFSKWRQAIGGNIKAIITGSAACQVKLLRFFTAAKIVVMEGYGLTETSPVISVNRFNPANRKFGTVGTVIKDVTVKITEEGEIICKGPNVMMGYYLHPELTNEVMKEGWFYTGDIGEFVDNKFLKITDRKKEIFKISGGKYVAPLPIENKMKESPYIEQIMVVGSNEKFVGALIVPSKEKLKEHFEKLNIPLGYDVNLSSDKDVYKVIRNELDLYNKNFSTHEQVKKFQILPNEWTIESGELTATMKLKRKQIANKYGQFISKIYE